MRADVDVGLRMDWELVLERGHEGCEARYWTSLLGVVEVS